MFSSAQGGFATGRSPVQGVLPNAQNRDTQTPDARSSGKLNYVRSHLISLRPRHRNCLVSHSRSLELWDGSCIFGKICGPLAYKQNSVTKICIHSHTQTNPISNTGMCCQCAVAIGDDLHVDKDGLSMKITTQLLWVLACVELHLNVTTLRHADEHYADRLHITLRSLQSQTLDCHSTKHSMRHTEKQNVMWGTLAILSLVLSTLRTRCLAEKHSPCP